MHVRATRRPDAERRVCQKRHCDINMQCQVSVDSLTPDHRMNVPDLCTVRMIGCSSVNQPKPWREVP